MNLRLACLLLALAPAAFVPTAPAAGADRPEPASAVIRPTAFIFVSVDCPIANRFAPTLQDLHESFGPGIDLITVYSDPATGPEAISRHRQAYALTLPFRQDPDHTLAKECGVTVTPEAAVFVPRPDGPALLIYRGRIDDRYIKLGQDRRVPTQHDLRDTLAAIAAGNPPSPRTTQAVGCYIE